MMFASNLIRGTVSAVVGDRLVRASNAKGRE